MRIFWHLMDEGCVSMGDRPGWRKPDLSVEVGLKAYHQRREMISAILVWGEGKGKISVLSRGVKN